MRIGRHRLANELILAPMAGVSDRPFRRLCRELGAAMAISEMVSANPRLRDTRKSRLRTDHRGEPEPRVVQIAGADPKLMAAAARHNVEQGAQIIDINMGCPAKKVCNTMAGSALLEDLPLVGAIIRAVVAAVDVPVTLKIRTGPDPSRRNAVEVARLAEDCGIAAVTVHGRTRADAYRGEAEYDTVRAVKAALTIPVIVNGDIDSPKKAKQVKDSTDADAVMIGRAAQGRPWLFRQVAHYLETGRQVPEPTPRERAIILLRHVTELHDFYGPDVGLRIARKHITWYLREHDRRTPEMMSILRCDSPAGQLELLEALLARDSVRRSQARAA